MTKNEWNSISAKGRRWAYFGSMFEPNTSGQTVRIVRWYKSGVRIRFADGHQETVHPDYLHI